MMKKICLILFFFSALCKKVSAQEICLQKLKEARQLYASNHFKEALNKIHVVGACDIDRKLVSQREELEKMIFSAIEKMNNDLKSETAKAKLSEVKAKEEARKSSELASLLEKQKDSILVLFDEYKKQVDRNERIISSFHFYNDSLALAYNIYGYKFINKNGDAMSNKQFTAATPFSSTGYARVKKIGDNYYDYLLDQRGKLYQLAKSWHVSDKQAEALEISEDAVLKDFRLSQFPNLKILFVTSYKFDKYLSELNKLDSLECISLIDKGYIDFPIKLTKHPKIKQVCINRGNFENIPGEIALMQALERLDLTNNKIKNIPKELGQLTNLEKLVLAVNRIESIPPEIGKLEKLQELAVSGNKLDSLPKEIGELKSLRRLNLASNRIKKLPLEIGSLVNLQELILSYNQFSEEEKTKIRGLLPNTKIIF
jgi:Leucine-rich repeat (LRR) protein